MLKELAHTLDFDEATDWGVSDERMDARECVLRYLTFRVYPYDTYSKSDLNSFLSGAMKEINGMPQEKREALGRDFRDAMLRAREIFGRYAFRKFTTPNGRRGPVNKALFESWANVLQSYDLGRLQEKKERLISRLAELFVMDAD